MLQDALLIPGLDVSRETVDRLRQFALLVDRWTPAINLISPASRSQIWQRHIRDSAQIVVLPSMHPKIWADLGSGAGFPGLVVAIVAAEIWPAMVTVLVESDQRKAAFLATVVREFGLDAEVRAERSETTAPINADIVSARALAPLAQLMPMASRHLAPGGTAILLKGRNVTAEIDATRRNWRFDLAMQPSLTDDEARVLRIERIERA